MAWVYLKAGRKHMYSGANHQHRAEKSFIYIHYPRYPSIEACGTPLEMWLYKYHVILCQVVIKLHINQMEINLHQELFSLLSSDNSLFKFFLPSIWSQAPTDRQLRYKEKVTELRRKRNSSLNKEQKEKYMVSGWEVSACDSFLLSIRLIQHFQSFTLFLTFPTSRITARATERAGSRCWRTSPATTILSCSGKRRHVPRMTL